MKTIRTVKSMRDEARRWHMEGRRIGLVPTMGFLHEGHLSLVRIACERADVTVVSIFVNPTQFGPAEDLERYPRDLERDLELCRREGVAAVFCPPAGEMYAADFSTWVEETSLSKGLCGSSRPGHFRGVTTIVAKLLNCVSPDVAVFGRKDAQQALVIRRMVRDLDFPVEIVTGPLIREHDGLAMSSRNANLSARGRAAARGMPAALREIREAFQSGVRDAAELRRTGEAVLTAHGVRPDYVDVLRPDTLETADIAKSGDVVAVAGFVEQTRLIDNCDL